MVGVHGQALTRFGVEQMNSIGLQTQAKNITRPVRNALSENTNEVLTGHHRLCVPPTNNLCMNKNSSATGSVITTEAAITAPQSVLGRQYAPASAGEAMP